MAVGWDSSKARSCLTHSTPPPTASAKLLIKHEGCTPAEISPSPQLPQCGSRQVPCVPGSAPLKPPPAGDGWALEHCQQPIRKNLLPRQKQPPPNSRGFLGIREHLLSITGHKALPTSREGADLALVIGDPSLGAEGNVQDLRYTSG